MIAVNITPGGYLEIRKKQQWYATPQCPSNPSQECAERRRVISGDIDGEKGPNVSGLSEHPIPSTTLQFFLRPLTQDMKCPSPRRLQYYLELVDDV